MGTFYRNLEFLQFDLANRSFCVDVDQVLGVITLPPHMKDPPATVPFYEDDVPVFSMEEMLNIEKIPSLAPKEIIILKGAKENYGILVTLIGEIHKVPLHRAVFRFPNSERSQIRMFGIWGMAMLGQELSLILEPHVLLDDTKNEPLLDMAPCEPVQDQKDNPLNKITHPSY